jgi:hypothetical protein
MGLHIFKIKNSILGLYDLKQFEYESLANNFNEQNLQQNVELRFNKGKLAYTKLSIFDYSCSLQATISLNLKSRLVYSRMFFRSNEWQNIEQRVSTLVKEARPYPRMNILLWHCSWLLGWPPGLKLAATKVDYNKPSLYILIFY